MWVSNDQKIKNAEAQHLPTRSYKKNKAQKYISTVGSWSSDQALE